MGVPVLIMGRSGTGKSTSLRNFKEAGIINVLGKPLPFRNPPKTYVTDDCNNVIKALAKSKAKSIVIDDAGYLMTNHFMRGHSKQGTGNGIFQFYNDIGDEFWSVIDFIMRNLPEDKIVYVIMHEEESDSGKIKPKTIGKMLDDKLYLEGMFTVALRSVYHDGKYVFKTNTSGPDVCKSPGGMFDSIEIDNDLKMVDEKIREFYNSQYDNDNESEEQNNEQNTGI